MIRFKKKIKEGKLHIGKQLQVLLDLSWRPQRLRTVSFYSCETSRTCKSIKTKNRLAVSQRWWGEDLESPPGILFWADEAVLELGNGYTKNTLIVYFKIFKIMNFRLRDFYL